VQRSLTCTHRLRQQQGSPGSPVRATEMRPAGRLDRPRDRDVFAFSLESAGTVEIRSEGAAGTAGQLFGEAARFWPRRTAAARDGLPDLRGLPAGRYFLRVESANGAAGVYTLRVESVP